MRLLVQQASSHAFYITSVVERRERLGGGVGRWVGKGRKSERDVNRGKGVSERLRVEGERASGVKTL